MRLYSPYGLLGDRAKHVSHMKWIEGWSTSNSLRTSSCLLAEDGQLRACHALLSSQAQEVLRSSRGFWQPWGPGSAFKTLLPGQLRPRGWLRWPGKTLFLLNICTKVRSGGFCISVWSELGLLYFVFISFGLFWLKEPHISWWNSTGCWFG